MPRFAKSGILKASAAAVWAVYSGCVACAPIGTMLQGECVARRIERDG